MKEGKKHNVYFLGIGGIGMSAIAKWYHHAGYNCAGYDKTPSAVTQTLLDLGIPVSFEDSLITISPEFKKAVDTLVIYTPAVPTDSELFIYFTKNGFDITKRSQALGEITSNYKTIAVAGTHGKTTTTTMVAHLLNTGGIKCHAFMGGISGNFGTNLLIQDGAEIAVVEADEYDKSFLQLNPHTAIITNMDADHLDIYGDFKNIQSTFEAFTKNISHKLIINTKVELPTSENLTKVTYGLQNGDYLAKNIKIEEGKFIFDLYNTTDLVIDNIKLGLGGEHNIQNAIAASVAAMDFGVSKENVKKGLENFKGVKRRLDLIYKNEKSVFYDDYAHHPEEVLATLSTLKKLYPNKKITTLFQPHLYSRTKDFYLEFAASLSLADEVWLLDIYPAREKPIQGITSSIILENITSEKKSILKKESIKIALESTSIEVFVLMGAGDIDLLIPQIKDTLESKFREKA